MTFKWNYCTDVQAEYAMWASSMCKVTHECQLILMYILITYLHFINVSVIGMGDEGEEKMTTLQLSENITYLKLEMCTALQDFYTHLESQIHNCNELSQ